MPNPKPGRYLLQLKTCPAPYGKTRSVLRCYKKIWWYTNQSLVIGTPWEFQGTAELRYGIVFKVALDERYNFSYCSFANMAFAFFNISFSVLRRWFSFCRAPCIHWGWRIPLQILWPEKAVLSSCWGYFCLRYIYVPVLDTRFIQHYTDPRSAAWIQECKIFDS